MKDNTLRRIATAAVIASTIEFAVTAWSALIYDFRMLVPLSLAAGYPAMVRSVAQDLTLIRSPWRHALAIGAICLLWQAHDDAAAIGARIDAIAAAVYQANI
jgi:hypothetical protein